MGFLNRLMWRLGFLIVMAVTIRLVGGLFSPAHPVNQPEMTEWPGNPGIPVSRAAIRTSQLAAPLDDPLMQQALASLPFHGDGPGAKMTYRSAEGPVTLTPNDVAELNNRYHRLKGDAP
ncbi:hypothetical protein OF829_10385 [Sphingomonas sp. LB-2]|uniref:hypothetical protein n=1 Tax=Sphingomonas caeni TaxID=2984949 RepID=UPI00222FF711|nr:hypothetical protein [Sphingomonas caeni]MCW3847651.1 hypothetical protein [Sphingomonas caeni]